MTIVVSDTSPIRAMTNLGLIDLLRDQYGEVAVPPAVEAELKNPPRGQAIIDLAGYPFVRIVSPTDRAVVARFLETLDLGESQALALAIEIRADLILMDEVAGRAMARQFGFAVTGVLGVLVEAKRSGRIELLSPLLDRLQQEFRFYVAKAVRDEALRLAGERP